jgi:phenylacetic acid degradation operon negative regulatory protein
MLSEAPLKALHAESPLRVWSLIVTIFGDIVMQQGQQKKPAPVWSGAITQLVQLMQIEPGLLRTNLSRLVANKTLVRIKSGRNTFYQLGSESRDAFMEASKRIYGFDQPNPTDQFDVFILDQSIDRAKARAELSSLGCRFIGPTVALKPRSVGRMTPAPADVITSIADVTKPLSEAAQSAWKIGELNRGYKRFLALFPEMSQGQITSLDAAIITRIIMVHQFRRLCLRDPHFPDSALPQDWQGKAAQERFMANLAHLSSPSQKWIETSGFLSGKASSEQD